MKKLLVMMIGGLVFTTAAMAQVQPAQQGKPLEIGKPAETVWLSESTHDFGTIKQGVPVYTWFEIKSTTADSLKLEMVQAGCGCTTPEFKAGTYAPGETVKIKVGYNAAAEGPFSKTITITYNTDQTKIITIKGEVWKTPSSSAPVNNSSSILKD